MSWENLSSGFPTRSDTNLAVQRMMMASFGFMEGLYFLWSKNKGAYQLRCDRTADLHLCFCICQKKVFSWYCSFDLMSYSLGILTALFSANLDDVFLAPEPAGFTHDKWFTCHTEEIHCIGKQVTQGQSLSTPHMLCLENKKFWMFDWRI